MEVTQRIEEEVAAAAGIHLLAQDDGNAIVLTGMVESETERSTVYEIAGAIAPDREFIDNLEVSTVLPAEIGELDLSEASVGGFPAAEEGTMDEESLEPGDFTEQRISQDPFTAGGPSGTAVDEEVSEGEESYVPPMDPVRGPDGEFIGGFAVSSMDSERVDRSAEDGLPGDEAIADAVRRELREDSTTSGLEIEVNVENGVVILRGTVADIDDVENAEEVAARLEGVREVREHLKVENL